MSRGAKCAVAVGMILIVTAGSAWAQAQAPMPAPPSAPAAPVPGSLEGKVKKVDLTVGTVSVSRGWFGLFGKTLAVSSDTQIQVEGRQGTLADVTEGAKVKALYETREGKNVATRIEVVPPQSPAPTAKAPQQ
jgi:Cu/Ag efflux protein CusF